MGIGIKVLKIVTDFSVLDAPMKFVPVTAIVYCIPATNRSDESNCNIPVVVEDNFKQSAGNSSQLHDRHCQRNVRGRDAAPTLARSTASSQGPMKRGPKIETDGGMAVVGACTRA
mmetsp:Transcript_59093/g.86647  ORF Transcript_59093/g.86647 Transcript_59093/m.86647 type:complete len:115 (-) Transcript_59093:1300-1644(-)